ncbi:glycosyltransferase family 4 protein [Serratia odorifera]|nr:glycosyltransferase family 1 protein [Serratia odorifera]MBJ2064034.1 glycosyltransferase family 4 protein [Serratia odorifera]PNK88703.1 glycosyltransferase family 1 protein [Serratia odorifera]RII69502.1 glycosyltransferase family 1 protein [Serratia odorifera]VDZ65154.1 Glycogen synthase [Serratia odorifera]
MIYVNARFLTQELTGVQRFAQEISLAIAQLRDDVVFVSPANILHQDIAARLNVQIVGTRQGHLWEQWDLPNYLRQQGNPLLINLCNTAPVSYKNKLVTHHDVIYKRYPQSFSAKFRLVYNALVPLMLKSSRGLLTVSEFSKKELHAVFDYPLENIHVIYNAVASQFQPSGDRHTQAKPYLLAVSSPNYHKNFHGLIAAFSRMKGADNIVLKIIGSANKNFSGVDFSQGSANAERIQFVGRVSDQELIALYSNAKAFVFPSLYEGFGIPPLEAQACGCAVISSNRASLPEVLAQSVIYFDPENTEEMTQTLERIVTDENLRQELVEAGYENVKRFDWAKSAQELNRIIMSVNR